MHGGSSAATSINGGCGALTLPDFVLEDEVHETAKVLGGASDELKVKNTFQITSNTLII
jgi:hypothetical protein